MLAYVLTDGWMLSDSYVGKLRLIVGEDVTAALIIYSLLRRGRYNSKEHLRDDMIRSRREEEAHLGRFFFLFVAIAT